MEDYSQFAQYQSSPFASFVSFALAVLLLVAIWRIFSKAGEAGWKVLIPFYNMYTEYKIFWGKGWFFLLSFVPVVNIVVSIMLMHKMSKSFGHGVGFTLGLIFLPYVFYPILAFGSDQYSGPQ